MLASHSHIATDLFLALRSYNSRKELNALKMLISMVG